jgi:cytolysin-activating lysine-acyltransferase
MKRFAESANERAAEVATALGLVASIQLISDFHRSLAISTLGSWAFNAFRHKQLHIFFSIDGRPIGYVIWGQFEQAFERKYCDSPDAPIHPNDWNEGDRLWILDLVVLGGYFREVAHHMKSVLFPEYAEARWLRRVTDPSSRRVMLYRRKCSLES